MTTFSLPSFSIGTVALPSHSLPLSQARRAAGGQVFFVDILDEEVIRVLSAHGLSASPLGLTTEETGQIRSFQDWFVDNQVVRFVNLSQFPNLVDADLRGTYASVEFGTALADDDFDEVSLAELKAYLDQIVNR